MTATTARGVALEALARIDEGAYANLVVAGLLDRSGLSERDRHFATDLVYGTTRMRRACDHLVDRYLLRDDVEPAVRRALRLGAYQLHFLATPPHAAVAATVAEVRGRARGLVNAVLRRVAESGPVLWPDRATEASYPDWIVERLTSDLGETEGWAALDAMNEPGRAHERPDGYVQDPASQQVAALVGADPGDRVADVCAAPGGKATQLGHLAGPAGLVAAVDRRASRARLVAENAVRTGTHGAVATAVADARQIPFRAGRFDRVLVDAPCSGLGVLHRRPDARWRIGPADVGELAALQREILAASIGLLRPGGRLVYSVCTLTAEETVEIDRWLAETAPWLEAADPPGSPWRPWGRGALLLPQAASTDGMFVLAVTDGNTRSE